jgi:hypothetical protein
MWHVWERTEIRTGFLVVKPEGKRPVGGFRRRWEDNTKMVLNMLDWRTWIDLLQDGDKWRDFVNIAMKLWVP